jgi:tRNA threonylcarbamoyladenosine biosynthesis protein TsaE
MKKVLKNVEDTKKFAEEFLQMVFDGDREQNVILLQGELGAGKTTFSQFLLEAIGAEGPFTSPTFVIMKKYEVRSPASYLKNIYHLDCYRVDVESVLDLSWEEIVADKNNLVLVEWPEKIKNILPEKYWLLKFEYGDDKNIRIIEINENEN